ncbi:MAG: hypothetical protein ACP5D9_03570 [Mariniphaga sp.]
MYNKLKNMFTFVEYKIRQDGDGYILVDRFTDPEFRPTYITEQNPKTDGRQLKVLAVFSLTHL